MEARRDESNDGEPQTSLGCLASTKCQAEARRETAPRMSGRVHSAWRRSSGDAAEKTRLWSGPNPRQRRTNIQSTARKLVGAITYDKKIQTRTRQKQKSMRIGQIDLPQPQRQTAATHGWNPEESQKTSAQGYPADHPTKQRDIMQRQTNEPVTYGHRLCDRRSRRRSTFAVGLIRCARNRARAHTRTNGHTRASSYTKTRA